MLNAKQLADLIIRLWAEMNPNAASLAPRESTIVYLAEELLRDHVVLHRDNWQTLETYHQWMRSVDDRLGVLCAALNMLDVPRREMRGKDGKRQRIVVKIEDVEESADTNGGENNGGKKP